MPVAYILALVHEEEIDIVDYKECPDILVYGLEAIV
jgi:hypothetical protein